MPPVTTSISDKHKLLGLDHLRAFAILYVIFFHYKFFGHPAWEPKIAAFGWTGVDLFFVLSGFLIAGQLFSTVAKGKNIQIGEFFIKRIFRIFPPYFLVLILYFSFPVLSEWGHLSPAWRYFTFTLNFGLDLKNYGTFSHAWSLCVEEQFYLVLPLCFLLFGYFKAGKKAVYLLTALFIAGFVARYLEYVYLLEPQGATELRPLFNRIIYYPTYNRLDGLLVGVSIAGLYTFYPNIKERINKYSNALMLAGVLTLVAAYFVAADKESIYTAVWGFPLIAVGYGMVVAAIVCPANILFNVKSKFTSVIATLSYSMYLTHKIVIHVTQVLLEKLGMDKNGILMMACCLVTSVLGAVIMRYAVEKPAFRVRDMVLKRWKASV